MFVRVLQVSNLGMIVFIALGFFKIGSCHHFQVIVL